MSPLLMFTVKAKLAIRSMIEKLLSSDEADRWGVILSSVLLWLVCNVALQMGMVFIGGGLWWMIDGVQPPVFTGDGSDPRVKAFLLLMGPLASVLAYIPVLLMIPFIRVKMTSSPIIKHDDHRNHRRSWVSWVLVTIFTIIGLFGVMQLIGGLFRWMGWSSNHAHQETTTFVTLIIDLMHGHVIWPFWTIVTIGIVVIVAPILEELLFRVIITGQLRDSVFTNRYDADGRPYQSQSLTMLMYVVGGLIFASVHLIGSNDNMLLTMVSMTVFGTVLSWLDYDVFRSFKIGCLIHCGYNMLTIGIGVALLI
jgi:membrane protease YdiL (CAAX protease family)